MKVDLWTFKHTLNGYASSMDNVAFTVYQEPVAMGRPRVAVRGGHAHVYTPSKSRDAMAAIEVAAIAAMAKAEGQSKGCSKQPFSGPVAVAIWIYLRMPKSVPKKNWSTIRPTKRPDIDNYVKLAMDGMKLLWEDDSQVVLLRAEKHYAQAGTEPRWEINVRSLE